MNKLKKLINKRIFGTSDVFSFGLNPIAVVFVIIILTSFLALTMFKLELGMDDHDIKIIGFCLIVYTLLILFFGRDRIAVKSGFITIFDKKKSEYQVCDIIMRCDYCSITLHKKESGEIIKSFTKKSRDEKLFKFLMGVGIATMPHCQKQNRDFM